MENTKKNTDYIQKAQDYFNQHRDESILFPAEISAPVMATFTRAIVDNEIHVPLHELNMLANDFLINEQLEEFDYCSEKFSVFIANFTFQFISDQELTSSVVHPKS